MPRHEMAAMFQTGIVSRSSYALCVDLPVEFCIDLMKIETFVVVVVLLKTGCVLADLVLGCEDCNTIPDQMHSDRI